MLLHLFLQNVDMNIFCKIIFVTGIFIKFILFKY